MCLKAFSSETSDCESPFSFQVTMLPKAQLVCDVLLRSEYVHYFCIAIFLLINLAYFTCAAKVKGIFLAFRCVCRLFFFSYILRNLRMITSK